MTDHLTTDPSDPRLSHYTGPEQPHPQHEVYLVLSEEERAKGFVRPVRSKYIHLTCQVLTRMDVALAETYARDPKFYGATYCCGCQAHFRVREFVWDEPEPPAVTAYEYRLWLEHLPRVGS